MRDFQLNRKTFETDIEMRLNIDGKGEGKVETGIGFLDHMLILFAKHGLFDLELKCKGDLYVDGHHTVEDIGISLGKVLKEALGSKEGIKRYSSVFTPMDESLTQFVIDISGRPYLSFQVEFDKDRIGQLDTELIEEFFRGFVNNSGVTVHIRKIQGKNTHHIIESIFKGFGRALDIATLKEKRIDGVMSTKGVI